MNVYTNRKKNVDSTLCITVALYRMYCLLLILDGTYMYVCINRTKCDNHNKIVYSGKTHYLC